LFRFRVWVTVWVNRLTHTKKCKFATKNTQNPKISGVFWSCWADSNRRPHPYQLYPFYFLLLSFVAAYRLNPLGPNGFSILLILSCRCLSSFDVAHFSLDVAHLVAHFLLLPRAENISLRG